MELQRFFDDYYRPLRLRGRSPATNKLYGCTIRAFGKFLTRPATLEDLADEVTLARFIERRQTQVSPYSTEKERSQLMSMAKLANERRMIPAMPSCQPSVLPDRVPQAWSDDELRRLFAAAASTQGRVGSVPASEFWPALILCAFESGERIGALLAAKPEHYGRPFLHCPAESRKGGRRARVYELSPELCDRLERVMGTERIFTWPHPETYLWDRYKKIRERAGITGKRQAFQQVRRSAISHIAKAGGDPVAFAGHAQAATTKRWYLDPRMVPRGPRPSDLLPKLDAG